PGIAALHGLGAVGKDGPASGLDPLGISGQALAGPAGVGTRFVPRNADDGKVVLVSSERAVLPESRAGLATAINKAEHGRPDGFVPQRHLLVATVLDELQIVAVADFVTVEKKSLDIDQPLSAGSRFLIERVVAAGADENWALRHDRHDFVQRVVSG